MRGMNSEERPAKEKWFCIWCVCESGKPTLGCVAEDGGGHWFEAYSRLPLAARERVDRAQSLAAPEPHDYAPSTMHMGDCAICGHVHPPHDWNRRLL
jgi:hypothetical protein